MFASTLSRAAHASPMQSRMRLAMGTFVTIEADAAMPDGALAAIDAAFAVIERLEWQLHPSRDGSELARINSSGPMTAIDISESTSEVLELAQRVSAASGGLFDPCLPSSEGGIADLERVSDSRVRCRKRLSIDLGGIAKGYAIDRALKRLREHGCENALVNIGGDLATFGPAGFTVGVRLAETTLRKHLKNRALAVSDAQSAAAPAEHRGYYARNPGRRLARSVAAVSAPSAACADALTKCALYCDGAEWSRLAVLFDAELIG